jgi:hypothetical protein
MKIQIGDNWQNKHDLTRVICIEKTDKYFVIESVGPTRLVHVKKFRTKLEKEVFFQHFEPVPELILTLE